MTSTSLNLSGKIDFLTVSVLRQIQQSALEKRVPFFIVGATARNNADQSCAGRNGSHHFFICPLWIQKLLDI